MSPALAFYIWGSAMLADMLDPFGLFGPHALPNKPAPKPSK